MILFPDMVLMLTPYAAEAWTVVCAGLFCGIVLALLVYDLRYGKRIL